MANSVADPASRGWQRVGRGGKTCAFCRMLIGRGDVYDSIRSSSSRMITVGVLRSRCSINYKADELRTMAVLSEAYAPS